MFVLYLITAIAEINNVSWLDAHLFSFRKSHLGSYLAKFMWTRRCQILGIDCFEQILSDVALVYEPEEWKTFAQELCSRANTERRLRKQRNKGVDMVSISAYKMASHGECEFMKFNESFLSAYPSALLGVLPWQTNTAESVLGDRASFLFPRISNGIR